MYDCVSICTFNSVSVLCRNGGTSTHLVEHSFHPRRPSAQTTGQVEGVRIIHSVESVEKLGLVRSCAIPA
jgi:hypothetical protein